MSPQKNYFSSFNSIEFIVKVTARPNRFSQVSIVEGNLYTSNIQKSPEGPFVNK